MLAGRAGDAQPRAVPSGRQDSTIPALMVSDLHFDPFHDPGKVRQLMRAPVSQWAAILSSPDSPSQARDFADLQKTCHARGVDTPYALLRSSLAAMQTYEPQPKFITVTGDLVAHNFVCRFGTEFQEQGPNPYAGFVAKTIQFVVEQLQAAFPGVPVYISLGNNDTECGDYRMDPNSWFLKQTAATVAGALPVRDRAAALQEFAIAGYYSVTMAPPMRRTRLIVLNDLFFSSRYGTCNSAPAGPPGDAEIAWLGKQLAQARAHGQRVWVMGHIPPGVNAYATITKIKNVCADEDAEMFLSSDRLDDLLMRYADVVRLALFAHTHMDEMRLIAPEGAVHNASAHAVAVKLVPSISSVDGNNPSFMVARVDPITAVMRDYEVIEASNQTGVGTTWSEEYDYKQTYGEPAFSPAAVGALIAEFRSDPKAKRDISQAYIRHYFKGDAAWALTPFWPQYVCSLDRTTARGYAACVCGKMK
jgi:sphingomyelin phosphodiesterase acid-like 3